MQSHKPVIGIFGNFQNGKSTLINCLLRDSLAKVGGKGMSVTDVNTRYTYGQEFIVKAIKDGKVVQEMRNAEKYKYFRVSERVDEVVLQIKNNVLKEYDLLDTPGLDANEQDTEQALNSIVKCDFAILVLRNKGSSQTEKALAKSLYTKHIPFVVLINCYNSIDIEGSWSPVSRHNRLIGHNIIADLKSSGITPFLSKGYPQILLVNLIWEWIALDITDEDESIGIKSAKRLLNNSWEEYFDEEAFSLKILAENSQFDSVSRLLNDRNYRYQWYLWNELNSCNTEINKFMESMKSAADMFHESFLQDSSSKSNPQSEERPMDSDEERVIPNNPLLDVRNFELF